MGRPTLQLSYALSLFGIIATAQQECTTGTAGVTGVDRNLTDWSNLWGFVHCTVEDKKNVLAGLQEAQKLLDIQAVRTLDPTSLSYWSDTAMIDFLGSGYNTIGYRSAIKSRFDNARGFKDHWWSWNNVKVFCENHDNALGICQTEPSYIAVANQYDFGGVAIGFCDSYFRLGSLDTVYNSVSGSSNRYNLQSYENRARAWVTAMFRIKYINGLTPQRFKLPLHGGGDNAIAESASQTRLVGKFLTTTSAETAVVHKNPSNYAWYAMAQYVRYKLNYYAYQPQVPDSVAPLAMTSSQKRDQGFLEARDQGTSFANDPCPGVNGSATGIKGNAVALYLSYSYDDPFIDAFTAYDPNKLPILIGEADFNQYTRPENITRLKSVVSKCSNSGKRLIVSIAANTGYTGEKTQKGSTALADWVTQIEEDINAVYNALPGVGGVFLQTNAGLPCGTNNMYANAFIGINRRLKQKHPGAYTVLSPFSGSASAVDQCFEDAADTLVTWLGSWTEYSSSTYKALSWKPKDARKLWHFVGQVPLSDVSSAASLAKSRNVGLVGFTDGNYPYYHSEDSNYYPKLFGSMSGASAPVVYM